MIKIFLIALSMVLLLSQSLNAESNNNTNTESVKSLESKQDFTTKQTKDSHQITPSFDCVKAKSKVERTICNDSSGELQNLDRYMSEIWTQLRNELKKSSNNKKLDDLLDSQRKFIKEANLLDDSEDLQNLYKNRIINLLKILGEALDTNNKELCEYARKVKFDNKWQEIHKSTKPPFSIGLCAFGRNNKDVLFEHFCTQNGEIKKEEVAKAIDEKSPYIEFPKSYIRKVDINNDGVLENVILTQGSYFDVLWIFNNDKLDEKASDRIYGDDLHFSGVKTTENICINSEEVCMALTIYALPANKISQRLEFYSESNFVPMLSELSYGIMEFQGKNYITLWNKRFAQDEDTLYPTNRIYLLRGNKRELKCTY